MKHPFTFWAGTEQSYRSVVEAEISAMHSTSFEARAGYSGAKEEEPKDKFQGYGYMIQQIGSTAVLEISGPLIPRSSFITRLFGMTGYDEIENALAAIVNEGSSKNILLSIDSPGGSVSGLDAAAATIKKVDAEYLPVSAHTNGQMTSAAYRLGAAAREVFSTKMAEVGSIGVIAIHHEITKMLDKEGVNVTVLRSGEFKALGNPYEKLDPKARAVIQEQMDFLYEDFVSEIAANRGMPIQYVKENAAEGRVFFGVQALDVGLVDGVESFDSVVKRLDDIHNSPSGGSRSPHYTGTEAMLRKKVVITEQAQAAMAAGVPQEEALRQAPAASVDQEHDSGTPEPEQAQETETETQAAAQEPQQEEQAEQPAPAQPPAAAASDTPSSVLATQLRETQDQLVEAKVELKQVQAKLASTEAAVSGLQAIAVEATQKMQIALGQSAADLSHLSGDALVQQYRSVEKTFKERFPVGATSQVVIDEPPSVERTPAQAAAAVKATKIRKEGK